MRRRDFITLIGGAATGWPLVARAEQPATVARIGYLGLGPASALSSRVEALRASLRDLGWVEGKNLVFEFRWADNVDQLPSLAADLVRMKVDVIFATSSTLVEAARQRQNDPYRVRRPCRSDRQWACSVSTAAGGNYRLVGADHRDRRQRWNFEGGGAAVDADRRSVIRRRPRDPRLAVGQGRRREQARSRSASCPRLQWRISTPRSRRWREKCRRCFRNAGAGHRFISRRLAELALKRRLPTIFGNKENVVVGGLMSYGVDRNDLTRRAALYIDKILKGAKPADLPVEQPTRFELVVNLKTARALGIEIPPTLLARADEVIE